MELVVESDIYVPSIDENGNYIDKVPSFNIIKRGLLCPCGSRRDKKYETSCIFSSHIKTKTHQKWLTDLNLNKVNLYIENEKLKNTVQNQKIIIAKMEKDINTKIMTIDYLTLQLNKKFETVTNLLEFD